MNTKDLAIFTHGGPEALAQEAERQVKQRRRAKAERRTKRGRAPGMSREERREIEDQIERAGKAAAYHRSEDPPGRPRCEHVDKGRRCTEPGVAADHVLGGSSKIDMERIGAEGFQILCAWHNDLKTRNSPTRAYWLDVAMEHALRVGARRLLPFIARARAKLEGKRLEPRRRHG